MIVHLIKEAGVESGKSWEVGFPRQTKVTLFTSHSTLAKLMNMIMGLMMMMTMMMMKILMMKMMMFIVDIMFDHVLFPLGLWFL